MHGPSFFACTHAHLVILQRAQEQADLVASIHAQVLEGLKGKEKDILAQCVADLETLAASR